MRLDSDFDAEWTSYRAALIADTPKPDLSGRDLRRADLSRAELAGLDFREARMEGADLSLARMEGADPSLARMEGADLGRARMEGANLIDARMEGANLIDARMEGADLSDARIEGANLIDARIEGANLIEARMEGADLRGARLEGAVLIGARFQLAAWAGATIGASPAHAADFRGGRNLSQSGLSSLIGDASTLLPERLEDGSVPYVCTCWASDPPGLDPLIALSARFDETEEELRDPEWGWFCPGGTPMKTGTPWPLDAAPPWGPQEDDEAGWDYSDRVSAWADAQPAPTEPCPPALWEAE